MLTKTATVLLGKHNDVPDSAFSAKELRAGMKVEREHTDSPMVAKGIAKDHLAELPDYYTRLEKMERTGAKEILKQAFDVTMSDTTTGSSFSPGAGAAGTDGTLSLGEYRNMVRGPVALSLMKAFRLFRRARRIGAAADHHVAVLNGDVSPDDASAKKYNNPV